VPIFSYLVDTACSFCVSDKSTNSTSSSLLESSLFDFSLSLISESKLSNFDSLSSEDFGFFDLITALNGRRVLAPLEISTEYSPAESLVFPIGTDPSGFNCPLKVAATFPSL